MEVNRRYFNKISEFWMFQIFSLLIHVENLAELFLYVVEEENQKADCGDYREQDADVGKNIVGGHFQGNKDDGDEEQENAHHNLAGIFYHVVAAENDTYNHVEGELEKADRGNDVVCDHRAFRVEVPNQEKDDQEEAVTSEDFVNVLVALEDKINDHEICKQTETHVAHQLDVFYYEDVQKTDYEKRHD